MKHSLDTFGLYRDESIFSFVIRTRTVMKDPADRTILESAVNTAIKRYPYFAVSVGLDEDGAYTLRPNHERVVVLGKQRRLPNPGRKEGAYPKQLTRHELPKQEIKNTYR